MEMYRCIIVKTLINICCEIYTKTISHFAPSLSMNYNKGAYDFTTPTSWTRVNKFLHLNESIYSYNCLSSLIFQAYFRLPKRL